MKPHQPPSPFPLSRFPVVAVTGGTGFIGSHLVESLLRGGCRVRLLVRSGPGRGVSAPESARGGVDLIPGDIRDAAAVERLLDGTKMVIHLAAYARAWARSATTFRALNVDATRLVCEHARRNGARVVHVSTELVAGGRGGAGTYPGSKALAERVVEEHLAAGGDAVIARPTRVFGPGPLNQSNSVTRVIDLYRRGIFRARIADGGARANYVFVGDVVGGLTAAADRGRPGATYVLGGADLTLTGFLDVIADVTGLRRRVIAVPRSVAHMIAACCELGGLLGFQPPITREWVHLLTTDRPMPPDQATAELGYQPRSVRDGVATTVAWLEAGRPSPASWLRAGLQSA